MLEAAHGFVILGIRGIEKIVYGAAGKGIYSVVAYGYLIARLVLIAFHQLVLIVFERLGKSGQCLYYLIQKSVKAGHCRRRYREYLDGCIAKLHFEKFEVVLSSGYIHLICGDYLREPSEAFAELGKLGVDLPIILHWIPSLAAGHIHHMNQHSGTLDVPEEVVAQTGALSRSLYKPRNIRQYEAFAIAFHNAKVGSKSGKVVICYFGLGAG